MQLSLFNTELNTALCNAEEEEDKHHNRESKETVLPPQVNTTWYMLF